MRIGDYPTSGDCRLYIGGIWVDDLVRIDWEESNRKVPLWGYHQKHYADVADGKLLVTGVMMIHYRFPGYLMYAIGQILNRRQSDVASRTVAGLNESVAGASVPGRGNTAQSVSPDSGEALDTLAATIESLRKLSPTDRARELAKMSDVDFARASQIMNAMFDPNRVGVNRHFVSGFGDYAKDSPVEMGPEDFLGGNRGFDMTVRYGEVENTIGESASLWERIEGVHLTGRRKVINAMTASGDLGGSGQSLIEVYPFFARRVQQYAEAETNVLRSSYEDLRKGKASDVLGPFINFP